MNRIALIRLLCVILLVALSSVVAVGAELPAAVERTTLSSTARVISDGRLAGLAVCVHADGYYVKANGLRGPKVLLGDGPNAKEYRLEYVRRHTQGGALTLYKVKRSKGLKFTPATFAKEAPYETQEVYVIGAEPLNEKLTKRTPVFTQSMVESALLKNGETYGYQLSSIVRGRYAGGLS